VNPALELPPARDLAQLTGAQLEQILNRIFEHSAAIAPHLTGQAFSDWSQVIASAATVIAGMSPSEQLELLRGHARIGEDPRRLKALSEASFQEQRTQEADGIRATMLILGQRYEEHFGFPFVEFVAGRPLADIVPVIRQRMQHSPDFERATGLAAIVAIAGDRATRWSTADPTPTPTQSALTAKDET
jgi:2-oxo-4-hydroxy-4-carboxy-5-ureidoimidazoline decarboxylase